MKKIRALISDMDGVLVLSEQFLLRCYGEVCLTNQIAVPSEYLATLKGIKSSEIFRRLECYYQGQRGYDIPALVAQVRHVVATAPDESFERPRDLHDFLARAAASFEFLSLVTSNNPVMQKRTMEVLGIAPGLFHPVITGHDVSNGKPHPEPILKCLDILGIHARQAVLLEDSVAGVQAGKAAGVTVIAITSTTCEELLRQAGADFVVDGLLDVFNRLA